MSRNRLRSAERTPPADSWTMSQAVEHASLEEVAHRVCDQQRELLRDLLLVDGGALSFVLQSERS